MTAGGQGTNRGLALAAALLGWAALVLQLGLTINNTLVAGQGAAHGLVVYFGFFTILTNIFAALVSTAHVTTSAAPVWKFFRNPVAITSATASILVVGSVYFFVLRRIWNPQGLQLVVDVLLHYVMPLLTLVFWWVVVPRGAVNWSVVSYVKVRLGPASVFPALSVARTCTV